MESSSKIEGIEKRVLSKQLEEMKAAHFETYTYFIDKIALLEAKLDLLTESLVAIKSHNKKKYKIKGDYIRFDILCATPIGRKEG